MRKRQQQKASDRSLQLQAGGDLNVNFLASQAFARDLSSPAAPAPAGFGGADAPFVLVDRDYLGNALLRPKNPFVARPPEWSDVVHGADPMVCMIERDGLHELVNLIRRELLRPVVEDSHHRLRSVFVTGSPGSGKTTLIRRALSLLVMADEAVVADLGPNHGAVDSEAARALFDALTRISANGRPVIVLLDDPFFVDSGWNEVLRMIQSSRGKGIVVAGASPTFLFDTYADQQIPHHAEVHEFVLGSISEREKDALRSVHGNEPARGPKMEDDSKEFMVSAMEAASGDRFDSIIERIWATLNGGIPPARRARSDDLGWPVLALLIVSSLHRFDVACPDVLLRASLERAAPRALDRSELLYGLVELRTNEGWRVFNVDHRPTRDGHVLIRTMHSRVAQRAWQTFRPRAIDPLPWLLEGSASEPAATPHMAEFLLASQLSLDLNDRKAVNTLVDTWETNEVSTAQIGVVARKLRRSSARLAFRDTLRRRMNRDDAQSWIAAVELSRIARLNSPEHKHLVEVRLPSSLVKADLSSSPDHAVELLRRASAETRRRLEATILTDLERRPDRLNGRLITWMCDNVPADDLWRRIDALYDWFDANPLDMAARSAFIEWHVNAIEIGAAVDWRSRLLHATREWIESDPGSGDLVVTLSKLVLRTHPTGGWTPDDLAQIESWYGTLRGAPHVFSALARLLRSVEEPGSLGVERLCDRCLDLFRNGTIEDEAGSLSALLRVLIDTPRGPVDEAVAHARLWLEAHPENSHVRADLIGLALHAPALPVQELVDETRSWLEVHPENGHVRAGLLALVERMPDGPVEELVAETRSWLAVHPENGHVRAGLLALVARMPDGPVAEMVVEARSWVAEHPDDVEVRKTLLAVVQRMPDGPVAELVVEARSWLAEHPDDVEVRKTLLAVVQRLPAGPREEVAGETRSWLRDHPHDIEVRKSLLTLVERLSDGPLVGTVVDTAVWLADHPSVEVSGAVSATVQRMNEGLRRAAIAEIGSRLAQHPNRDCVSELLTSPDGTH